MPGHDGVLSDEEFAALLARPVTAASAPTTRSLEAGPITPTRVYPDRQRAPQGPLSQRAPSLPLGAFCERYGDDAVLALLEQIATAHLGPGPHGEMALRDAFTARRLKGDTYVCGTLPLMKVTSNAPQNTTWHALLDGAPASLLGLTGFRAVLRSSGAIEQPASAVVALYELLVAHQVVWEPAYIQLLQRAASAAPLAHAVKAPHVDSRGAIVFFVEDNHRVQRVVVSRERDVVVDDVGMLPSFAEPADSAIPQIEPWPRTHDHGPQPAGPWSSRRGIHLGVAVQHWGRVATERLYAFMVEHFNDARDLFDGGGGVGGASRTLGPFVFVLLGDSMCPIPGKWIFAAFDGEPHRVPCNERGYALLVRDALASGKTPAPEHLVALWPVVCGGWIIWDARQLARSCASYQSDAPRLFESFHLPRVDGGEVGFYVAGHGGVLRVTVSGAGRVVTEPIASYEKPQALVGRPYVDDAGLAHTALPLPLPLPTPTTPSPSPAHSTGNDARALWWRDAALGEHASVASFARSAMELMSVGAPLDLVRRCHEAALDELRHTELSLDVARAIDGAVAVSIGPLPALAPRAGGWAALAERTLIEAALPETLAAAEARAALSTLTNGSPGLDGASSATVHAALTVIARDEQRHAELAWDVLATALERGGDDVARALAALLARGLRAPPAPSGEPVDAACGLLGTAARDDVRARALADDVVPPARALGRRRRALSMDGGPGEIRTRDSDRVKVILYR